MSTRKEVGWRRSASLTVMIPNTVVRISVAEIHSASVVLLLWALCCLLLNESKVADCILKYIMSSKCSLKYFIAFIQHRADWACPSFR